MTRQTYSSLSKELQEFLQREGVNLSANEIHLRKHVLKSLDEIVTKWGQRVYQQCRKQSGAPNVKEHNLVKMLPQGSYYLQTDDPTSDIDVIVVTSCCIRRRNHFFGHHTLALQAMLKQDERAAEVVAISSASVPLLRFRFYGIDIDMGMCQLQHAEITDHLDYSSEDLIRNWVADEESRKTLGGWRSTIAIRDLWQGDPQSGIFRNYKLVVRLLKLWAKRRGLYSNVLGYFGGINISILVGRILQTNSIHTTPAEMVFKFFKVYDCEWGTTFGLFPFPGSQHVLDPSYSGNWQSHAMKIITPTLPQINSSSSVFPSSLTVIRQEIQRGKQICQKILEGVHHCSWSDLTEPINFWNSYNYFLIINISVSNKDHLAGWQGKVISKIRKLAIDLQHLAGLVRPWTFPVYKLQKQQDNDEIIRPPQDQCEKCVMYFLSLEKDPENANKAYFDNVVRNFRQSTISEYMDENIYRNGMDVKLSVVHRCDLPEDCFKEGNSMEQINYQRLGDFEQKLRDAALNSLGRGGHYTATTATSPQPRKTRWHPADVSWICKPIANHDNIRRGSATDMTAAAIQIMNSKWLLNSLRSPVLSENQSNPVRSASGGAPYSPANQPNTQKEGGIKGLTFQGKDLAKQLKVIVNADKNNNYNSTWKQRASAKSFADLSKLLKESPLQLHKQQVPLRRSASEVNSSCSDSQLFKENMQQSKRRQLTPAFDGQRSYSMHQQQFIHPQQYQKDNWNNQQGIKIQVTGQNSIACHRLYEGGELEQLEQKRPSFSEKSFPVLQRQEPQTQQSTTTSSQGEIIKLHGEDEKNLCPLSYADVVNKAAIFGSSCMVTPSSTPELGVFEDSASPLWSADEQDNGNPVMAQYNSGLSQSSEEQVKFNFQQLKQLDNFCVDENPEMDKVKPQDLLSILSRNTDIIGTEDVFTAALSRSGSGSQYYSDTHTNLTEKENGGGVITVSGSRRCSEESDTEQVSHISSSKDTNSKIYQSEIQEFSDDSTSKQVVISGYSDTSLSHRRSKVSKLETIAQQQHMEFANIEELKQSILGSSYSATESQSALQRNSSEIAETINLNSRNINYDSDTDQLHTFSSNVLSLEGNELLKQQLQQQQKTALFMQQHFVQPDIFHQNINIHNCNISVSQLQQNTIMQQDQRGETSLQQSRDKYSCQQDDATLQEQKNQKLDILRCDGTNVQTQPDDTNKQTSTTNQNGHDSQKKQVEEQKQQKSFIIHQNKNINEVHQPKITVQEINVKVVEVQQHKVVVEQKQQEAEILQMDEVVEQEKESGCLDFEAFMKSVDALPERKMETYRNKRNVKEEDETKSQQATELSPHQSPDQLNKYSEEKEWDDSSDEIVTIPNKQASSHIATVANKKYSNTHTRGRRWRRDRRSYKQEKRHAR